MEIKTEIMTEILKLLKRMNTAYLLSEWDNSEETEVQALIREASGLYSDYFENKN